jgi:anti-sigma factor RsiW
MEDDGMDHEKLKHYVFSLYDGQWTNQEREIAIEHLDACPECREELKQWESLSTSFFSVPVPADSDAFVREVMGRIREEAPAKTFGFIFHAPGFFLSKWMFPAFVGFALSAFVCIMSYPVEESRGPLDDSFLIVQNAPPETAASSEAPKDGRDLSYVIGEL